MQTLFKPNLFSNSSSKVGAKNFVSGGKKLGSSIVGAAKNNIIGFNRTAQAMMPEKKEENENSFIKNYVNFFGSKKTEKILRKNLKLVKDSLVNTFEIARHLKAAIIGIAEGLKGGGKGKGGGMFGGFMDAIKTFLIGGIAGALIAALPFLLKLAAIGSIVGIGIALWKSEKFRELTMDFIKFAADKIWNILKPLATATMKALFPSFIKDDGSLNWQKFGTDPWSAVGKSIKEVGPEKTLELLRQEYNEQKEAGKFDSIDGKLTGLEEALIRQMRRVEGIIAKEEKVMNFDELKKKELFLRTNKIKQDRLKTKEWRTIQDLPGNDPNKPKLQTAYHKETKKMIREMAADIEEKYKNMLIQGSTGGNVHESVSGLKPSWGRSWEGSSVLNTPASSSSVSAESNSKVNVNGEKNQLNNLQIDNNLLTDSSLKESTFKFEPVTFNMAQAQDSSGGISNTSSGNSPSGSSVTFFPPSNSDPSYHKLNALLTFNIV